MLLCDEVCIVTGAASLRGIGYAIEELFAEHARVAVADLAMNEEIITDIRTSIDSEISRPTDLHGVASILALSTIARPCSKARVPTSAASTVSSIVPPS